jgi:hypothetical protein
VPEDPNGHFQGAETFLPISAGQLFVMHSLFPGMKQAAILRNVA